MCYGLTLPYQTIIDMENENIEKHEETLSTQDDMQETKPETPEPGSETPDFAGQFARWLNNPLISIAMTDARLCRFIGDLIAGDNADSAVARNFPHRLPEMPADVATRHHLDEDASQAVSKLGQTVMKGDWSDAAMNILLRAARHDDDVKNAEAAGYLRGRNEAIEVHRRKQIHSYSPTEY